MTDVVLPSGLVSGGARHREATVRALSAEDALLVLEAGAHASAAAAATLLLSRAVTRLGDVAPVTEETARALTVGDREALLLHVRRETFGESVQCVIRCPACEQPMDLDLEVGQLLVDSDTPPDVHDIGSVRVRLPNGGDQEAIAAIAARDPGLAGAMLLERCLVGDYELTPEDRSLIAERISELDPQSEITLALTCPECGTEFVSLFDAGSYLMRESASRARDLLREVHLLASVYHWSEREILAMSDRKRRIYLSLIAESRSGS